MSSSATAAPAEKHYLLHARVLAIAEQESAKNVHEIPARMNNGPDVSKYQRATWLRAPRPGQQGWPWCVAFWQWCTAQAGLQMPYEGAGAYNLYDWAKAHGFVTSKPMPGDAVVFDIGTGHLGVFDRIEGAVVHTIDGNWQDRVMAVTHRLSDVRGYVHVPEKPVSIVVEKPAYEVVTSASGTTKVVYVCGANAIAKKLPELLKRFGKVTIRPGIA